MPNFELDQRRAETVAREAGRRFLRERNAGVSVGRKGVDDVVTNVDMSVEKFLREELTALFPDDALLGEELGAERQAARCWLIDPVDGTLNLTRGVPLSCVSVALQVEGESVVGVVYDPYLDELFSARRGAGTSVNGKRVTVAPTPELNQAVVAIKPNREHLAQFHAIAMSCRDTRRLGTAALELAYVAAGRMDAFIEYGLKPWDTAAGYLLVAEAGGRVSDAAGRPYDIHGPCTVATNGPIHAALVKAMNGG